LLFVDLKFFLFFAIVLTIYWSLRSNSARKNFVLLASYYFYGSWDWRFAGMLLVLSTADWWFALRLSQTENQQARKIYVTCSLAMNLSVLGFFKYFHFFLSSAQALADSFKLHLSGPTLQIILPVGVSFFTFQSLSYTIDVYRREIPPVPSLRDYLMFSSFFPQLVAGPIVRPRYFVPQMAQARTISRLEIKAALYLFALRRPRIQPTGALQRLLVHHRGLALYRSNLLRLLRL
jgi:alginate O-acetyltransferase complex protein AlgI